MSKALLKSITKSLTALLSSALRRQSKDVNFAVHLLTARIISIHVVKVAMDDLQSSRALFESLHIRVTSLD